MPRCIAWDKVDNPSPQSTPQLLLSFEEYTPPVTYPEEVDETIGIPIDLEPLDQTQLEDVALGWHLEEIYVTWAHLGKKRTRLQLYTKFVEEYGIQWLETTSGILVTPSGFQSDGVKKFETASELNRHSEAL
ncbi:hypothetical protein Tco_1411058 [Tanacetum coccineum]